jgi:hypothetical protein
VVSKLDNKVEGVNRLKINKDTIFKGLDDEG